MPASGDGPFPVVLICHENRGLTPHIQRRRPALGCCRATSRPRSICSAAKAARPRSPIRPRFRRSSRTIRKLQRHVDDFKAAAAYYGTQENADAARLGMTGFCFGGGITWRAATQMPELKGAAPYYGPPPPLEDVPNIRAAVLGVYSDDPDDFANEGREELVAALEAAGVTFEIEIYPDTQHAFHNDTGPRWNEEQALAAWNDTVAWFETYVKSASGEATPTARG